MAFSSNESGRGEIHGQEFPEARSKSQASADGGSNPSWRGDGRELHYRDRDLSIMAVPTKTGATFDTGTPQALFKARFARIAARSLYRPIRDGQRFIALQTLGREAIPPATVVLNWTSVLK